VSRVTTSCLAIARFGAPVASSRSTSSSRALSGSTSPVTTTPPRADRQADRQAGLLEGLHQPGEIVPRHGVGSRRALLPAAHQLAEQGGHRGALVGEHAQVALGRGQRERVGQGGQRAGLVAAGGPGQRLEGPDLDDAAGAPLGGRPDMQPIQQP
jgi:hypothetical protein